MKLLLQTVLIFCFAFVSGQNLVISGKTSKSNKVFNFDYLVYYTSESDGKTRNVLGYINSKNSNYVLKVFTNTDNKTIANYFRKKIKKLLILK